MLSRRLNPCIHVWWFQLWNNLWFFDSWRMPISYCRQFTADTFWLKWGQCEEAVFFAGLFSRRLFEPHSCNNSSWARGAPSTHTGHLYLWIHLWLTGKKKKKKSAALWLRGEEEDECEILVGERGEHNQLESEQVNSVNHRWDPVKTQGGGASPFTGSLSHRANRWGEPGNFLLLGERSPLRQKIRTLGFEKGVDKVGVTRVKQQRLP